VSRSVAGPSVFSSVLPTEGSFVGPEKPHPPSNSDVVRSLRMKTRSGQVVRRRAGNKFHKWVSLPEDLKRFIICRFLDVRTTLSLSAAARMWSLWFRKAYASGNFKSYGFDDHIYTSFKAVNWVLNEGIVLRKLAMMLMSPVRHHVSNQAYVFLKAIASDEAAIVELMLRCGRLDSDAINGTGGVPPLTQAILDGSLEITRLLLKDSRLHLRAYDPSNRDFRIILRTIREDGEFREGIMSAQQFQEFDRRLQCLKAVLTDERCECSEEGM